MKVAFDIHGVLDSHQSFRDMMVSLYAAGHDTYIISGQPFDSDIIQFLDQYNLSNSFVDYFSIETELLLINTPFTKINASKVFLPKDWNPVKAKICARENIDILFDDTEMYKIYFEDIETQFVLINN